MSSVAAILVFLCFVFPALGHSIPPELLLDGTADSTPAPRGLSYAALDQAYAALGFNPHQPGNSVVVFFSDPHMNLWDIYPIATNLDRRLVNVINSMNPAPEKIIVGGDVSTTLSPIPGWTARSWSMDWGTNEMLYWLRSIHSITNVAQTNILWVVGNHDQLAVETNAETFRMMFPMMPVRQRVDIAGMRFLLINSGNYAGRNPEQTAWLREQLTATSPSQPVGVVLHVPPFQVPLWFRGIGLDLRDVFSDWPARWWILSGHYHSRSSQTYRVGGSTAWDITVGTASPLAFNGKSDASGTLFLCISNGIAGVVYYHYNDGSFEAAPKPDWGHPTQFIAAFEAVPGLLWRRLKAAGPLPPEVESVIAEDAVDWFGYTGELHLAIPLRNHNNQATHFLLFAGGVSAGALLEYEATDGSWVQMPLPTPTNNIYSFPIPASIMNQPTLRVRYTSPGGNDFVAGWGLATTNPPPWNTYPRFSPLPDLDVAVDQLIEVNLANSITNPYAPPDIHRFTLQAGPTGASVDPITGMFRWEAQTSEPTQTVSIVVKVQDMGTPAMTSTQQFFIHVTKSPKILQSPASVTRAIGNDTALEVVAAGASPLTYTWFFNGAMLTNPAVTSSALSLTNLTPAAIGDYVAVVRNTFGAATSAVAHLTVDPNKTIILVSTGAVWRYHDSGEDLGSVWRDPGYQDNSWPSGAAPLGFGYGNDATLLASNAFSKPITVYLRRSFDWSQAMPIGLNVRLFCEGGAVLYWNGTEFFRYRMNPGPVNFNTHAIPPIEGEQEPGLAVCSVPTNLIQFGTNVFAVELHQYPSALGPAAFWTLDEAASPWRDSIGTNDFVGVGTGLAAMSGRIAGCVSNGASGSWLEAPDAPKLKYGGPFTVGGWFAFGQAGGDDPPTTCLEKPGEFRLFYTGTATNRYRFRVGNLEVQDQTPGTASGQWRFVVGWCDQTNGYIQVNNGTVYSAAVLAPSNTANPLVALKRTGAGGFAADEIFFYRRLLSAQERQTLFSTGMRTVLATNSTLAFDLEMSATTPPPPFFVQSPADLVAGEGAEVEFRTSAFSTTPVGYQWEFNGSPLSAATNDTLMLNSVSAGQSGEYAAVAHNWGGTTTSGVARLLVIVPPEIKVAEDNGFALHLPTCAVKNTLLSSTNLRDWAPVLVRPAGAEETNYVIAPGAAESERYFRLWLEW